MSRQQYNTFVEKLQNELETGRRTGKPKLDEPQTRRQLLNARETVYSIESQFIREAVMRQAPLLKKRWPAVDLEKVITSTQLMLRDAISKNLKGSTKWFDSQKTIVVGRNFRAIQDLMTAVKKTLRNEARAEVSKNAKKLESSKFVSAETANTLVQGTMIITGVDVRDASAGGDIVPEDLKDGVIVASASKLRNLSQRAESTILGDTGTLRGIEIGHTFGPGLANMAVITRYVDKKTGFGLIDLFQPDIKEELIAYADEKIDLDASHEEDVRLFKTVNGVEGKLTVTVTESADKNNKSSAFKSTYFLDKVEENMDNLLTIQKWLDIGGSPSIKDKILDGVGEKFTKGKVSQKNTKSKRKAKVKRTKTVKIPIYGPGLNVSKSKRKPTRKEQATTPLNLNKEINLINTKLHDKIRENMGKGGSKQTLNYRTGRFAKSAKLESFFSIPEKNAVGAQVKYMRYPYGTFEPGGRLHKPGRDPHGIFGRSIRQILQEEKIANLRRVKVKLNG